MSRASRRNWCFKITAFLLQLFVLAIAAYGLYDILRSYTASKYFAAGTGCVTCGSDTPFVAACTSNSSTGINATTALVIERTVSISSLVISTKSVFIIIFVIQFGFAMLSIVLILVLKFQLYSKFKNSNASARHGTIFCLAFSDIVLGLAGIGLIIIPVVFLARLGTDSISFEQESNLYIQNQCDNDLILNFATAENDGPPGIFCSTFNVSAYSFWEGSGSNSSEYIAQAWDYFGTDHMCNNSVGSTCEATIGCFANYVVGGTIAQQQVYSAFRNNLIKEVALSIGAMLLGVIAIILELADGW